MAAKKQASIQAVTESSKHLSTCDSHMSKDENEDEMEYKDYNDDETAEMIREWQQSQEEENPTIVSSNQASTHYSLSSSKTPPPTKVLVFQEENGPKVMAVMSPIYGFWRQVEDLARKLRPFIDKEGIEKVDHEDMPKWYWNSLHDILELFESFYSPKVKRPRLTFAFSVRAFLTPSQIFSDNTAALEGLFDWRKINHRWDARIIVVKKGTIHNEKFVVYILVPVLRTNDITMAVMRPREKAYSVHWNPGSVVLVPGTADMKMSGPGRLLFLGFGFGRRIFDNRFDTHLESQRWQV
ncbi:hypothetical protein MMC28_011082 [Mycoblastus sanguinarius]|nr:hypothetical protein [Mycoblastus sanguinarius]